MLCGTQVFAPNPGTSSSCLIRAYHLHYAHVSPGGDKAIPATARNLWYADSFIDIASTITE